MNVKDSINYIAGKIKGFAVSYKEEILTSLIIVFVGSASYGAGVLSTKTGHPEIEIRQSSIVPNPEAKPAELTPLSPILEQSASAGNAVINGSAIKVSSPKPVIPAERGSIVASRNGVAYYLSHCNSSRILDKNKIYFKTEAEAQKAGYHLAANCKRPL